MGDYRITIDAVGGHGCQREVKDGGPLQPDCGSKHCPDCAARRLVAELQSIGNTVMAAKLEHWPESMMRWDGSMGDRGGSAHGPIDDLKTGVRSGSF
jgi:hypothetical protein